MVYAGFAVILPVPPAAPMPGRMVPELRPHRLLRVTLVMLVRNIAQNGLEACVIAVRLVLIQATNTVQTVA